MADSITIKSKESPRFEGNTLKWYFGNTFPYTLHIALVDSETGENIEVKPEHSISVAFYAKRDVVHEFKFSNLQVEDVDGNSLVTVTLDFNQEVSDKFVAGTYTYCITYYGEQTTTIAANMNAEVEKCH